jgi:hypothetical protein
VQADLLATMSDVPGAESDKDQLHKMYKQYMANNKGEQQAGGKVWGGQQEGEQQAGAQMLQELYLEKWAALSNKQ